MQTKCANPVCNNQAPKDNAICGGCQHASRIAELEQWIADRQAEYDKRVVERTRILAVKQARAEAADLGTEPDAESWMEWAADIAEEDVEMEMAADMDAEKNYIAPLLPPGEREASANA